MAIGESSTPLGRVRGLGPARHGGAHWIRERLTSVALLLLGAWLLASLLLLPDLDQRTVAGALFLTALTWFIALGVSQ